MSLIRPWQRLNGADHSWHRVMHLPWLMILLVMLIGVIGILALYSAAEGSWSPWAFRHSIRLGLGFGLMVIVALIPLDYMRQLAWPGWLGAVAILLLLEFIGSGQGVQRWISVGSFNLQPSEPAKLAVIITLAAYFNAIYVKQLDMLRVYIPAFAIVMVPFGLILAQPDLGTSLMLLGSAAAVIFVAGIPLWLIAVLGCIVVAAIPAIWISLYQYQRDRILVFLNPENDTLGAGWQITQSKIALGSGGMFGKGYLKGSQSHLNYLPEKQTDFVFTMIGEEFGLIGCLVVIALYMAVVMLIIIQAFRHQGRFARLLLVGIAMMLFLYVFINIGMVSGILPVVGAPLPLISYGGTAMMTVFISFGLVISAALHEPMDDGS